MLHNSDQAHYNRELWRSEPIYILQKIPNYQLRTTHDTARNNLAINCIQGSELELPKLRGTPPHGTPSGLITNVSFRLRPL
jgi:hypothetical protein